MLARPEASDAPLAPADRTARSFFQRVPLSVSQQVAVSWPAGEALQILAGPGSGKTRTLTARVAFLVEVRNVEPSSIVVVTFTNRAAQEMRDRLSDLVGPEPTAQLRMGTFHSVGLRFLRQFPRFLPSGLRPQFVVAGEDDVNKMIKQILARLPPRFKSKQANANTSEDATEEDFEGGSDQEVVRDGLSKGTEGGQDQPADTLKALTARRVRKSISSWKTFEVSVEKASAEADTHQQRPAPSDLLRQAEAWAYGEYEQKLRQLNALDFDDIILRAIEMLEQHPEVVDNVSEVLVDEFQDTSLVQLKLVNLLAQRRKCLTVVGDPDQSIYGWRAADRGNLERIHEHYGRVAQAKDGPSSIPLEKPEKPAVPVVLLEESYRSAGGILALAQGVIEQDVSRSVAKDLIPIHPPGSRPVAMAFASGRDEARWIAQRIQYLVANSGGLLTHKDFAILVRQNSLSRALEAALAEERVHVRLLGTVAFFQRKEVADMVSYLHLVYNPNFTPSFERVVNVPPRRLGGKFVEAYLSLASRAGLEPMVHAEKLVQGEIKPDKEVLKPAVLDSLLAFARLVLRARTLVLQGRPLSLVLKYIIQTSLYDAHLEKLEGTEKDSRINNLLELVTFAAEVDGIKKKDAPVGDDLDSNFSNTPDPHQLSYKRASPLLSGQTQSPVFTATSSQTQSSRSQSQSQSQSNSSGHTVSNSKLAPSTAKSDLSNKLDLWLDSMDVEISDDELDILPPSDSKRKFEDFFGVVPSATRGKRTRGLDVSDSFFDQARMQRSKQPRTGPASRTSAGSGRDSKSGPALQPEDETTELSAENPRKADTQEEMKHVVDLTGGIYDADDSIEDAPDDSTDTDGQDMGPSPMEKLGELVGAASLSSSQEEDGTVQESVTISTCHGAKGLEWPVVFLAGCEANILPSKYSDLSEEVRLLFVALTRAQAQLYLTCAQTRGHGGKESPAGLSSLLRNPEWRPGSRAEFVHPKLKDLMAYEPDKATTTTLGVIAAVLGRPCPTAQDQSKWMQAYVVTVSPNQLVLFDLVPSLCIFFRPPHRADS